MSACSLSGRSEELLGGVDLALWGPCIDAASLAGALSGIDALGDAGRTAPPPELIFEPLRYGGPADFDTVIIGQDPYATQGDAQGLCFSVPAGTDLPASLVRVFGCLDRGGLRPARPGKRGGDLRPWAVQGVLLINSAWTTRVGARRAHAAKWKNFADEFVRRFCAGAAAAGRELHFLLWGKDAQAFGPVARRHGHRVHAWSHPSPMCDNSLPDEARFRMCPHFEEVNAARAAAGRRPICWDNLAPVVAFSDGCSDLVGKKGVTATLESRAGFAAVVVGGQFGAAILRGEVCPALYALADEAAPERGVCATDAPAPPTNNRGEWMGLIYCFLALLRGHAFGSVEVVSDSKNCVDTLLAFLPARLRKGTERELKNFDLVWAAWRLLERLRGRAAAVALTHVRSHQKPPAANAPGRERFLHAGNAKADAHASAALGGGARCAVEVLDSPAVLQIYARPGTTPLAPAPTGGSPAAPLSAGLGAELRAELGAELGAGLTAGPPAVLGVGPPAALDAGLGAGLGAGLSAELGVPQ